jgi:pimeloyl-ACP methyl ester carboxylesterase
VRCLISGETLYYVEHGAGIPLVALHGSGVDHREIEVALEAIVPRSGYRRVYLDLPGMGRSTADGLNSNDEVVRLLGAFIDRVAGGSALVLGHSYGAYLARGLAAHRPDVVRGLALLCPLSERSGAVPDHHVVRQEECAYDELHPAQRPGFDEYFVVRTPETARRYRDHVVPGTMLADTAALARVFGGWAIDMGSVVFEAPVLIAAGRHDSVVGYADAARLSECYPNASLAVVDDAGHALLHERPDVLATLISDWLYRVRPYGDGGHSTG